MKKIHYTNTTGQRKTVAGMAVAPGATVLVDERDHPDYQPAPVHRPRKERSDPVLALLDNPVRDIIAKLADLSDAEFERLQQGEKDGKTRKSLLEAFDAEFLRRAEAKVDGKEGDPGE